MSVQNLRHHLHILERRGLVAPAAAQPAAGRGRPEQSYALTTAAQPNHLAGLSSALLRGLRLASLRGLAQRLLGALPRPAGNQSQRLLAAIRHLEPLGYRPRWEARPDGPQVVLGNCPFAAIIEHHPELCQMDAYLLEELLGSPAAQTGKLVAGPQGTPQCVFKVAAAKAAAARAATPPPAIR